MFSSDDSMNSDNSFNSSIEEDETDGNKNESFRLQKYNISSKGVNVIILSGKSRFVRRYKI